MKRRQFVIQHKDLSDLLRQQINMAYRIDDGKIFSANAVLELLG